MARMRNKKTIEEELKTLEDLYPTVSSELGWSDSLYLSAYISALQYALNLTDSRASEMYRDKLGSPPG